MARMRLPKFLRGMAGPKQGAPFASPMRPHITGAAQPQWGDAQHTQILCTITLSNGETHPFNAMATDPDKAGRQLWADLNAGKYGAIAAYVAPTPPAAKPQAAPGQGPHVVG